MSGLIRDRLFFLVPPLVHRTPSASEAAEQRRLVTNSLPSPQVRLTHAIGTK
jgi:hypothetical protein